MPFLKCAGCEATVYFRTASSLDGRSCSHCGAALISPARQLSTAELRMRRRAKLPHWLLEPSDSRLRTTG
jgi:hypothetical protein